MFTVSFLIISLDLHDLSPMPHDFLRRLAMNYSSFPLHTNVFTIVILRPPLPAFASSLVSTSSSTSPALPLDLLFRARAAPIEIVLSLLPRLELD